MGFGGLVQTVDGRNELAKAELGERFQFMAVSLGDGQLQGTVSGRSSLVNEIMQLPISKIKRDGSDVILECDFNSRSAPKAFYLREIGIIANEKLCFYDNAGADAEYIDPDSSAIVKQKRMRFVLAISSSINLSVTLDEGLYALEDDLKAHTENGGTHITPEERSKWNAKQDAMTVDSTLSSTSKNPVQNRAVKAALDGKAGTGHTHSAASATAAGFLSAADKRKLDGIDENANNYTHPSTHPASMVSQDATHRFVTDAEKQAWDALYAQLVEYTDGAIARLIGSAPPTLDTLKEIADAIAENRDVEQALNEAIGKKASQAELDTHTGNNIIHVTATDKQGWNKDIAEREVAFTQAATRANIVSREKVKVLLGKIRKWFADMKAVAFTGSYTDLINKPEIPSAVRVKGDAEKDYRVGDVNLTAENIGAAAEDGSNAGKFVLKKQGGSPGWDTAYRDLADYCSYGATPKYYRIKLPGIQTVGIMLYMELSFRQSQTEGMGGKLMVAARHTSVAPYTWQNIRCAVSGTLGDNIGVFASDGMYFYISGGNSYSGISVDRILAGDTARYHDLSGVEIDTVDSLPETYQTAAVEYTVSKAYLDSHFVPDYISRESASFSGPGWKKVAVINDGAAAGVPCVVSIKRSYGNTPGEFHRVQFLNCYGRYGFASLAGISHTQLVKKMRLVINAGGKSYIEAYYEGKTGNASDIAIEGAVTVLGPSRYCWEALPLEDDTETPASGTVAAEYGIPANFNVNMLAMKDGSNVDGVWEGLAAGSALGKFDNTNGDLGRKPPSYIGDGRARFRMMRGFKGLDDPPGYMDCLLMNTYRDSTQKYATALGILKKEGCPRAYIAVGDASAERWNAQAELVTTANISTVGIARADEAMGRRIIPDTADKNFSLLAAAGMYGVSGAGGKVSGAPVMDGYGSLNWSIATLDCGRGKKLQAAAAMYDRADDKKPAGVWLRELGHGSWFRIDALGACRALDVFSGDIELDETGSQFAWADATDGFGGNYLKSMGGDGESQTKFMHLRTYGYASDLPGTKFTFVTEHVITITENDYGLDTDAAVGAPVMAGGRNFGGIEYCGTTGNTLNGIALAAKKFGDQMDAASIHVTKVEFLYSA